MSIGRHLGSSAPWLISAVLALAFVHHRVELRKAHREIEQMREHEQQLVQARWQLAGHYRRLEVERQKLAREQEQRRQEVLGQTPKDRR